MPELKTNVKFASELKNDELLQGVLAKLL